MLRALPFFDLDFRRLRIPSMMIFFFLVVSVRKLLADSDLGLGDVRCWSLGGSERSGGDNGLVSLEGMGGGGEMGDVSLSYGPIDLRRTSRGIVENRGSGGFGLGGTAIRRFTGRPSANRV